MRHLLLYTVYKLVDFFKFIVRYFIIPPVFYLKKMIFRLEKIKKEMVSTVNTMYNLDLNANNYQYKISPSRRYTLYCVDKIGKRFSTRQSSDKNLWFDVVVERNNFPVWFDMNKSLNKLSAIFDIEQILYFGFERGHLKNIRLELRMLKNDNGVYIERNYPAPCNINIFINICVQENMKVEYEAHLASFIGERLFHNSFPLQELFQLIHFESIHDIGTVNELLPELRTPSAYDFNSDDFKQRLTLLEMFHY